MFEGIKKIFKSWNKKEFIPLYSWGLNSLFEKNKYLSQGELLNLYTGYSYVCISAISEGISWLERALFSDENEDVLLSQKYHEIIDNDFLENVVGMLKITWIAYIQKIKFWKTIEKLKVLRSDLVTKRKYDDYYLYSNQETGRQERILKEDIFYIKSFSPFLSKNWYSPLQAISNQQLMDNLIVTWNMNFFKNGASSGTVLYSEKEMKKENKEYLVAKWKNEFMGVENAHKVVVLDNGLKQEKQEIWQKNLDFVNQRTMIRDEIFTIFRVPKVIVGITDGVGYTDRLIGKQNFAEYVLNPLAKKIEEALNKEVFNWVWVFRFLNVIPIDYEQLAKDYQLWVITLDEYRIQAGYKNVKDGDKNFFWEVLEIENNGRYETRVDDNEKKLKDLGEKINKSLQKIEKKQEKEEIKQEKKEEQEEILEKKLEARREKKIKRTDKLEGEFKTQYKKLLDFQKQAILKALEEANNKKALKDLLKLKEGDFWSKPALKIFISKLFKPLFTKLYKNENKIAIEEIEDAEGIFFGNIPLAGAIPVISESKIDLLFKSQLVRFAGMNTTTSKEIIDIIHKGYNEGLGYEEIVNKVQAKFTDYSRHRINTIARTEISHAVNNTREETRKELGSVKEKQWFTALDERVCKSCGHEHGRKIPLQANFYNKGDIDFTGQVLDYEDISTPPLHPNCRCDLIPVF